MSNTYRWVIATFVAAACTDPHIAQIAQFRLENEHLRKQVESLELQLVEERTQPSRLLASSQSSIAAGTLQSAKDTLYKLVERHGSSPEAAQATKLIADIDAKLAAAEKARVAEIEREQKAVRERTRVALARMKSSRDDIRGITWHRDRSSGILGSHFQLYFAVHDNQSAPTLRLKVQYSGDDWLFVERLTVKADDRVITLPAAKFERDNGSGTVWEWCDEQVTDELYGAISAVLKSKRATLRYDGDKYYKDRIITDSERASMRAVIDAFLGVGGSLPLIP